LLALVQNGKAPSKARLAGLEALSSLGTPELNAAISAASADSDPALKTEASKLLGKSDPETACKAVERCIPKAAIAQKKQICNALGDNRAPLPVRPWRLCSAIRQRFPTKCNSNCSKLRRNVLSPKMPWQIPGCALPL
jgi:hypothetical protein